MYQNDTRDFQHFSTNIGFFFLGQERLHPPVQELRNSLARSTISRKSQPTGRGLIVESGFPDAKRNITMIKEAIVFSPRKSQREDV